MRGHRAVVIEVVTDLVRMEYFGPKQVATSHGRADYELQVCKSHPRQDCRRKVEADRFANDDALVGAGD